MALTKQKKQDILKEVSDLLTSSKMTVLASYPGTTVKAMQALRKEASYNNTTVKIFKNRLVTKALEQDDRWKDIDKSVLKGQILYAFNPEDEVAPAQVLAAFAKSNQTLEFVGAISGDGKLISAEDIKIIAELPTKDQLRGQLIGLFQAPMSGFVNVLSGNLRGVLNALSSRMETLN